VIALIASALLGLYVFVPYILFHRLCSLFLRLKKFQRTKTDEIVFGVVVAGLPFLLTLFLFWHGLININLVPYPVQDTHEQRVSDYRMVAASVYSEPHFKEHEAETWTAAARVYERQIDFLTWNYILVLGEIFLYAGLTAQYGRFRNNRIYGWVASKILLPAVSEWHILLTNFNFPPGEKRSVAVDVMTKDNLLYRADVVNHFLGNDGELFGLLLKNAQRFQYDRLKDDRAAGSRKDNEEYWKLVSGGGNFYIAGNNISSLNIRYPLPELQYAEVVRNAVKGLDLKGFQNVKVETFARCRCTNTAHGHGNPCKAVATNDGQMCAACHKAALLDEVNTAPD
jgi:hypothetical protein